MRLPRGGPALRALAALGVLLTAWIAFPAGIPVYDGVGFPDEPYRYVVPPAGYQHTPAASSASATVEVQGALNARTVYVHSAEQAPQVALVLPGGMVATAPAADSLSVTVRPEAPDAQPAQGRIDGNVYAVSASTTPSGTVRWAPAPGDAVKTATVTMRATSARTSAPVFVHRAAAGQPWQTIGGYAVGNDVYAVQFAGFGDYALAFGVGGPAHHHSSAAAYAISGALAAVLLLAGVVVAVRLARRRSPDR